MFTYLMTDGRLYKIGRSSNPEKRIRELKTANPFIRMVCYGSGIEENTLHKKFGHLRVSGEWFDLEGKALKRVKKWIGNTDRRYVMPHGQHKGKRLYEIRHTYLRNYLKRRTSLPEVKAEIESYLE